MKASILLRFVLVASFLFFAAASFGVNVPKPMAIDIDDLGWKEGWDLHESGGPYRLGLPRGRMMGLADYEVVVYIGKAAGVRIKSLFIMSEFDRSNICAAYPTTNEHGSDWDNSALVSDGDFTIMDYVKDNAAHIEFGLHGVRHEFWDAETRKPSRAEWADSQKKRPYDVLWGHLECYKKLLDQYGIDFPKSVRTAAANFYYNPDDPEDSGALMRAWGVKYATLPPDSALVDLEMFGTQEVKAKLLFEPHEVTSDNSDLEIKDWRYESPFINMTIHGHNIQGQAGTISIKSKATSP